MGDSASLSQVTANPVLGKLWRLVFLFPLMFYPQSKSTSEPTDLVTQAWAGMEQHLGLLETCQELGLRTQRTEYPAQSLPSLCTYLMVNRGCQ